MGLFTIGITVSLMSKLSEDSSVVVTERGSLKEDEKISSSSNGSVQLDDGVKNLIGSASSGQNSQKKSRGRRRTMLSEIKYQAKQVIKRGDVFEPEKTLPTGTNLIGKLVTSIDTRETSQIYKVLLPYGGKSKSGAEIPKNTIIHGMIKYPGKGKKVFIKFNSAFLPDGREVKFDAQALSSSDYSPGILGKFHGKAGVRLATTLGLTVVSGMTETLVKKKAHGKDGMVVTPEATLKNGLYQGISRAADLEANRQAGELNSQKEYVTIPSGQDLIVSLTGSYKIE